MLEKKRLIYIKRRTSMQWITMFIVIMPLLLQALLQFFNFPGVIKYTVDIAWITAVLYMLFSKGIKLQRKIVPLVIFIAVFGCYCLITYMLNYQSVFYFLWGFRNNFRFYFAFLAILLFLEHDDIDCIFKIIDVLFVINIFVSIYQIFVLNLVKDFCGGIFGAETGSNASTLMFFSIVTAKTLLEYMNGREKTAVCCTKCVITLILAVFAELKVFFVIFVLILIVASFVTSFSVKKLAVALIAVLLVSLSGTFYQMLFESELSLEAFLAHFTYEHYASAEDVGRFTAIPHIAKTILTNWSSQLLGLGLGNCDTSAFAICNTPFFQNHRSMNYIWFSSACWFLETGIVGLCSYLAFFIICFVKGLRLVKRRIGNLLYSQLSVIMSILCVILTFYNASLRTEIGFLAFFVLALPFVKDKEVQLT